MPIAPGRHRIRFRGQIAGVGTTSGTRIVIGRWDETPLGAFADAMVERSDGHRLLLAPSPDVARFIAATYEFDEIRIERFGVRVDPHGWRVRSESLDLDVRIGGVTGLGRLLTAVPDAVATAPWWCTLTDVVARHVLDGVRTRGETRDRLEWYGATANRTVDAVSGTFDGADLGGLAPVDPPPRFGFSSTPARPSVTDVVTTIELDRSVVLVGPGVRSA
ncbi:hypothetical protein [Nocardioides sp.]|uniref:hypothetical protein n=1 Tax=Nocardioides sp. TaxID=35761 RepID=UPI00271A8E07|nr:hypothetical protein [Nocardioides sp.]MDO9456230.1 hypothetical protein [Nocardioides sp.]